jgi:hypothetical protein
MAILATRTRKINLPKTGQTSSYEDYDDGYYECGSPILPRLVDNGDNTITDRVTNLMWIKDPFAFYGAVQGQAKGIWITGNSYIIGDIVDDSDIPPLHWVCQVNHTSRPSSPAAFQEGYSYVAGDWFDDNVEFDDWNVLLNFTSPTTVIWANSTLYNVNDIIYDSDVTSFYICLISHTSCSSPGVFADDRAAYPTYWSGSYQTLASAYAFIHPTFLVLNTYDNTLLADRTEHPTYWTQTVWIDGMGSGVLMLWEDALTNCYGLNIAGHNDWKLPNITELLSLIAYNSYGPAIDGAMFINCQASPYWSSTTYYSNHDYVWDVDFNDGKSVGADKTGSPESHFVRPVRQL